MGDEAALPLLRCAVGRDLGHRGIEDIEGLRPDRYPS